MRYEIHRILLHTYGDESAGRSGTTAEVSRESHTTSKVYVVCPRGDGLFDFKCYGRDGFVCLCLYLSCSFPVGHELRPVALQIWTLGLLYTAAYVYSMFRCQNTSERPQKITL